MLSRDFSYCMTATLHYALHVRVTPSAATALHTCLQTIDLLEYLKLPAKPVLQFYHVTRQTSAVMLSRDLSHCKTATLHYALQVLHVRVTASAATDLSTCLQTIDLLEYLGSYVTESAPAGWTLGAFPWCVTGLHVTVHCR